MRISGLLLIFFVFFACAEKNTEEKSSSAQTNSIVPVTEMSLVILGTIQDAGSPHIACKKECCASLFDNPDPLRKVVSLGVIDPETGTSYLFEATPDISTQLKHLSLLSPANQELPDGIFLTHAHIGHYSGLMYLGKEATNANRVPVYAMPRMKQFLENNGPWGQLVADDNIVLSTMEENSAIVLSERLKVIPLLVPHRDEYSVPEKRPYLFRTSTNGPNGSRIFRKYFRRWTMPFWTRPFSTEQN